MKNEMPDLYRTHLVVMLIDGNRFRERGQKQLIIYSKLQKEYSYASLLISGASHISGG
jgi:hypothetical protein